MGCGFWNFVSRDLEPDICMRSTVTTINYTVVYLSCTELAVVSDKAILNFAVYENCNEYLIYFGAPAHDACTLQI